MIGLFQKVNGGFTSNGEFFPSPVLPNGDKMKPFKKYKIKLLRNIEDHKKDDILTVEYVPNGYCHIIDSEGFCIGDGIAGKDFKFVE